MLLNLTGKNIIQIKMRISDPSGPTINIFKHIFIKIHIINKPDLFRLFWQSFSVTYKKGNKIYNTTKIIIRKAY